MSETWQFVERAGLLGVRASGELDALGARRLESDLLEREGEAPVLVLDLRRVSFIDSSMVGVLIDAQKRAQDGGRRLLILPGGAALRVLTVLGLHEGFLELATGDEPELRPLNEGG